MMSGIARDRNARCLMGAAITAAASAPNFTSLPSSNPNAGLHQSSSINRKISSLDGQMLK
jgi:hypothetical protein